MSVLQLWRFASHPATVKTRGDPSCHPKGKGNLPASVIRVKIGNGEIYGTGKKGEQIKLQWEGLKRHLKKILKRFCWRFTCT